MEDVEIGFLAATVVLGVFLLYSYLSVLYWRLYAGGKNENTVKWLWAWFSDAWLKFGLWCFFAVCATISYLVLFITISFTDSRPSEKAWYGVSIFNLIFLLASCSYPWLMWGTFYSVGRVVSLKHTPGVLASAWEWVYAFRQLTITTLFMVAVSAGVMIGFVYELYGIESLAFASSVVLTFHCTVVDLFIWGYTWYSIPETELENIYHNDGRFIPRFPQFFTASMDTDPSTMGVFSRLRIRQRDVQVAV